MSQYEIVFDGQLVVGAQPERVKANLGKLFQADATRLNLLFSGRRLVLKNGLDATTAEKYRATLERAGAHVEVVPMAVIDSPPDEMDVEEVELARPPDEPAWLRKTQVSAGRLQVKPRDLYMAAFVDVDAPDYSLAEAGSDILPPQPQPAPPLLDLSRLSVAPVGTNIGQARSTDNEKAPDTSHLKLV
ncbi:hypothetical protein [Pseudomonas triticifolii]|uniref:Uncharacterized protein n=1 Tax=Pseudomonas triticifolii TaxID=2762592 RepID=A0ABR7BCN3_9PSED|nr:hypothetical protein [Pseudomonas triticifolii]MBC3954946.1 hypothetical protein [Pseudomonas triticifolii]